MNMRVVWASGFGGPEVLVAGRAEAPVAGPGQVVVAVEAVSITFVETQIRRGESPGPPLPEVPYVPGNAIAGRVMATGEGVAPAWRGKRVVTETVDDSGGYAEQAPAAVEDLLSVPDGLGLPEAAALLHDGSTALGLFDNASIQAGEWVLVEAAAGGLGSLLVQLARAAGARVIGAARGKRKLDVVSGLGAEVVVDYSEPDWTERLRDTPPTLVFDGVGGAIGRAAFDCLAPGGRFSIHGAASGAITAPGDGEAQRRGVTVLGLDQLFTLRTGMRDRVQRALAEAAAGRLTPTIGQTYPLEQAAEAHAAIESRAVIGKTLLLP
ncbi:zinc-binding dehydrogenase [Saccharopolyspora erythraea]|nr:zinc-binding dehydrogenase [Saccharopolyspora erythraea]